MSTEEYAFGQMTKEERVSVFIESRPVLLSDALRELEQKALADGVPIIRPGTQSLLQFFAALLSPKRILEVGTAVGFSALVMEEVLPEGSRITTIERDEDRFLQAEENFRAFGKTSDRIELLKGDAAEILPRLPGTYDMIFMDAAKGQYVHFLPEIKRLLPEGGILISDNILEGGELLMSKYAVTRRNRTIHKRMREYLDALTGDPELRTLLLETGDGTALSVKRAISGIL